MFQYNKTMFQAGPSGRVGLRPLACWDCGFEYRREHGCLYLVNVVCCQVGVSRTDWSLVQRSPTDCGASLCVIWKPQEWGGHGPCCAAVQKKKKKYVLETIFGTQQTTRPAVK